MLRVRCAIWIVGVAACGTSSRPVEPPSAAAGCHPVDVQTCGAGGGMRRDPNTATDDPPITHTQVRLCDLCVVDSDCTAKPEGQCVDVRVMSFPGECASYQQCAYAGDPCFHPKPSQDVQACTAPHPGEPHHYGPFTMPP
jgi:hypothetical protein